MKYESRFDGVARGFHGGLRLAGGGFGWGRSRGTPGRRPNSFAAAMATISDSTVVMMIGKMSLLIWRPSSASSSTGGMSCTLAVLMASSMTIGLVAVSFVGLSVCSYSIALMPNGVAALPSPNTLAARLSAIRPSAGWSGGISGKSGRRMGRTSFTSA